MNHVEFIEHHIKTKLTCEGFSPAIAQGGQMLVLIITGAAHKPAKRERCLRTVTGSRKPGQTRTRPRAISRSRKNKTELRQQVGLVFFKPSEV
ncbi:hypothetical protein [Serratia fonticola]|uniref:hypothetical protein n=1 Tax=Serratia fonticola TaxID=47917 RepID=UPI001FD83E4A|nr:hypothetical protein [Serratia fonticola]